MLTGDNGILKKAQEAKEKTEEATRKERADLDKIEDLIGEATSTEKTVKQVTDLNPGVLEEENGEKIINSIEDLVFFANSVTTGTTYEGATVKLGLSLDFNSSKSYVEPYRIDYGKYGYDGELKTLLTGGEGFRIIGTTSNENIEKYSFAGTFDGNNNVLKNLYINKNKKADIEMRVGLFGNNKGTIKRTIKNLKIIDGNVSLTMTGITGDI